MKIGNNHELVGHVPLAHQKDDSGQRTEARSLNPFPLKFRRTEAAPADGTARPRTSLPRTTNPQATTVPPTAQPAAGTAPASMSDAELMQAAHVYSRLGAGAYDRERAILQHGSMDAARRAFDSGA